MNIKRLQTKFDEAFLPLLPEDFRNRYDCRFIQPAEETEFVYFYVVEKFMVERLDDDESVLEVAIANAFQFEDKKGKRKYSFGYWNTIPATFANPAESDFIEVDYRENDPLSVAGMSCWYITMMEADEAHENKKLWEMEQEYLKSNNLIAEFMGYKNTAPADKDFNFYGNRGGHLIESMPPSYHKSWDDIMPVVEKINNMEDEHGYLYNFQIGNGYVWVDPHIGDRIFFSGNDVDHRNEPMIDKVYRGVLKFIMYHNTLSL